MIVYFKRVLTEKKIKKITPEEFEKFLYDIGGIYTPSNEYPYNKSNTPIYNIHFFSVREGWYGLLKEMMQQLIKLGWNREIQQVKEKFGTLRFYSNLNDKCFSLVAEHENLSAGICELCGECGELRKGNWMITLCDKHCLELKDRYKFK
jgi:hypothetical protein